jgi:hypothetical protein
LIAARYEPANGSVQLSGAEDPTSAMKNAAMAQTRLLIFWELISSFYQVKSVISIKNIKGLIFSV